MFKRHGYRTAVLHPKSSVCWSTLASSKPKAKCITVPALFVFQIGRLKNRVTVEVLAFLAFDPAPGARWLAAFRHYSCYADAEAAIRMRALISARAQKNRSLRVLSRMPRASAASNVEKPWKTRKRNAARRRLGSATAFSIVTCWSFFSALRRASSCLSGSHLSRQVWAKSSACPNERSLHCPGLLAAVVNDHCGTYSFSNRSLYPCLCTRRVAHHNGNLAGDGAGWGFHGPSLPYAKRVPSLCLFVYF